MQNFLELWGFKIPQDLVDQKFRDYIASLPIEIPSVFWLWSEMNRIWDELGLDNRNININLLNRYYSHPIWVVNGIFSKCDPESMSHRLSLARFINNQGSDRVADYGGGFGELALTIQKLNSSISIDIIEPYANNILIWRIKEYENIKINNNLSQSYNIIIFQDVLEHVTDPIQILYKAVDHLEIGGKLVLANCFYPVIKCHLPSTFYLRHTIKYFLIILGLRYEGKVEGAEHAIIFKKIALKKGKLVLMGAVLIAKTIGYLINSVRKYTK